MHRRVFGHSFAVLVAPILVSVLVFNFLNKKKASARRNAKDADAGASANSGRSSLSTVETTDSASCSSPTETDNGASSSSTASTGNCYEVFLSFRGPDTRYGFTSHLYKELLRIGIHAFRDDDELPQGKSIGPELTAAITNSKILIPILSVTYGTSSWCLDELVRIMECQKNNEQMVLPIFYKVKPAEVGHQTGSFGDAFRKRERRLLKRPSFDPTILENWKKALAEVSKLKGYEAIGDEAKLVESVGQKVLRELKKKFELVNYEDLVGIDNPMKEVMEFVDNKSHATLFIGIYGMGGIGKTTLAKAISDKLSHQFEHRSFIADIRESWKHYHIHHLQNQLIYDILKVENGVHSEIEGTKFISSRFKHKKVLVILDDVDDVSQLKCFAEDRDWFSLGSIIIITTRDKRILEVAKVDYCYEHQEMDYDQYLTLFSKHAFRKDSPPNEFEGLAREVVPIAGGLPLCLEVLGSLFCGKESKQWRFTIEKLEKVSPKKVQQKLMISFLALEHEQKQIFLDIACFFIGTDWRIASYMWDACDFFPRENIEVLRFMSLMKIGDDHKLIMHDQLRDLGRAIVREENQEGCRSRLWDPEEALDVLKRNKGTNKIQAIRLSGGGSETKLQFKNLTSLRFLQVKNSDISGDFKDSNDELRWLHWSLFPMEIEVKNFHVKKLAVLELPLSEVGEHWEGWSYFKMAEKLKFLDLSGCVSLENTDFLSAFKNLEVIILNRCMSMRRIDSSIGDMEALLRLELRGCQSLEELPAEIGKLKALEQLLLSYTEALSALPDSIGSLQNLEILDIYHSGIEELPDGIGSLTKLRELDAFNCINLRGEMPESMSNISSLRFLDFRGCSNLQLLPDLPSSLTYLHVTCRSHNLPSLSHLTHLKELNVYCCRSLKCIHALPSELPESLNTPFKLETLQVFGCDSIETLDVSQFMNLRTLSIERCYLLLEVRGLDKLIYLEELTVECCGSKRLHLPKSECLKILRVCVCNDLVEIQGLDRLEFLENLNISNCTSIETLDVSQFMKLRKLYVQRCSILLEVRGLDKLIYLEELTVRQCGFKRLDLPKSEYLKTLLVCNCDDLVEIQGLDRLEFLENLTISYYTSIERLDLSKSRSLRTLYAESCEELAEIQGLDRLEFLEELHIKGCPAIKGLDLRNSGRLKKLKAEDCENLVEIQGLDRLEFLGNLNISNCTSIERLDLSKSRSLRTLYAESCKELAEIQGLERLEFLEKLRIKGCPAIKRLDLRKFGKLKKLEARDCENLVEIQGLDRLEFLENLNISNCTSIERLDLIKSRSLRTLYAESCKELAEIQGLDRLEFLEKLNIEGCTSIKRLDLPKSWRLKKLEAGDCENLVEIQGLDRLECLEKLRIIGCKSLKTDLELYRSCIYKEKLFETTEYGLDYLYFLDE